MSADRLLRPYLVIKKLNYLNSKKAPGGDVDAFVAHCLKDSESSPEGWRERFRLLIAAAAREAWGPPAPQDREAEEEATGDLFTIAGVKLPGILTRRNPAVPSGFTKTLTVFAPLAFVRKHSLVLFRQGTTIINRAAELDKAYEAGMTIAGDDDTKLISDIADKVKRKS